LLDTQVAAEASPRGLGTLVGRIASDDREIRVPVGSRDKLQRIIVRKDLTAPRLRILLSPPQHES